MPNNFVDYSNAHTLMTRIAQKFNSLGGVYILKGSCEFASIPATPTAAQIGFAYNITDDFTTDSRFVEGTGKRYTAGTNIAIADLSTYTATVPTVDPAAEGLYELDITGKYVPTTDTSIQAGKTYYTKNEVIKYDVLTGMIDTDYIEDRIDDVLADLADEFDSTQTYTIGSVVTYQDKLYEFTSVHTANDPWDPTEVTAIQIIDLVSSAEPDSLTTAQVNALLALLS